MAPATTLRPDLSTRLVVLCQRRPWLTSLGAALVIAGAAGPWTRGLFRGASPDAAATALLLVPAAFAFLAHAGRGGRTTSDRLAPWLAANAAALAASFAYSAFGVWSVPWKAALLVTLTFALWPLVTAVLLPGDPPGDETPAAVIGYPATLLLFPPLVSAVARPADRATVETAVCLAVVPLAFHAVVRSRVETRRILALAVLGGAIDLIVHPRWQDDSPADYLDYTYFHHVPPLLPPAVWLGGALLAVAARRCRSMTAVPVEHPIVEDFGAATSSARAPSRRP